MFLGSPVQQQGVDLSLAGVVALQPRVTNALDAGDLNAAILHEVKHIRLAFAVSGLTVQGMDADDATYGQVMRDSFLSVYNLFFGAGGGAATRAEWQGAGRRAANVESEVSAHFFSISHSLAGDSGSNFFILNEAENLVTHYNRVLGLLRDGVPFTTVQGQAGHLQIGAPARGELLTQLQAVYDGFQANAVLRPVRAITTDAQFNINNAGAVAPPLAIPRPVDR